MTLDPNQLTQLYCPQCGYSLTGLPDDHQCPECGFGYQREAIASLARSEGHARLNYAETVLWFSVAALLVIASAVLIFDRAPRWQALIIELIPAIAPGAAWFYRNYTGYEFEFSVSRIWLIHLGWPLMIVALLLAPFASSFIALGSALVALLMQYAHRPRFPHIGRSVAPELVAEVFRIRRIGLAVFAVALVGSVIAVARS